MKNILQNEYLGLIVRIIVGAMFVIVGLAKIADPVLFAKEITNYNLMPDFSINIFAIVLPWIELISGLLLIAGVRIRANAVIIGAMLIMFIIAVASAWARGLNINCGCFSHIAQETVGLKKILENSGLLILCVYLLFFPGNVLTLDFVSKKEEIANA